jgi:signal transduction histidine kinase
LRWEPIPHDLLVPAFAAIVAVAIMRHQLLDIRVVLNKALVYSALVACITASYLVVVLVMERGFQGFFGYRSFVGTTLVAFLIALFFNPLRNALQALVDRALFAATPAELASQREQLLTEVRKGDQMKAVGTLAAGLAHEIKNPLSAIKTFTEHLDEHYQDPSFRAKFRKIVGSEVDRINLIVQQLLEFAKPVPPKLMPVQVTRIIEDTLAFLTNDLVQRHVEVQRRYADPGQVLADPQQLKQVFLNLMLNSLQAMNGRGQLSLATAREGSELVVTLRDNGNGIAAKDLPHIFEPFYTTKDGGTGLGLAVVQGIIREHGGRILVESEPGKGTTVTVSLPIMVSAGIS